MWFSLQYLITVVGFSYCTFFTVWLSILHVKRVAPDWLLAGDTDETGHVPGLFQGIHDLLQRRIQEINKEQLNITI